jgi:3-hydroxyanthranilate 3,4-dioxygenase
MERAADLKPINFQKWIDEHRDKLKPPVGNQQVYEEDDFIVMVIGGPNVRKDFHINKGPEFFYQLEGEITVRVRDGGEVRDVPIQEGEILMLPPDVPHSPIRPKDTVGLVIERKRLPGEKDGFEWYCEACGHLLYNEYIDLDDIVKELPQVFERFWSAPEHTTCANCGTQMQKPI